MESNDLKSSPAPDDAAFETWLRTNAALSPLADEGFSRRVLVALPPARRRTPRRALVALAAIGGVIALVAAVVAIGREPAGLLAFNNNLVDAVNQLLSPAGSGALALTIGSLWYAFRDRWRPVWLKRF
jgi:hypothetical protein